MEKEKSSEFSGGDRFEVNFQEEEVKDSGATSKSPSAEESAEGTTEKSNAPASVPPATSPKSPIACIMLGMAGSGKTTLMQVSLCRTRRFCYFHTIFFVDIAIVWSFIC